MQVRLQLAEAGACIAVRGDGTDGHVRMPREEAQDFSPGVAAGSGDGNRNSHAVNLTAKVFSVPDIYAVECLCSLFPGRLDRQAYAGGRVILTAQSECRLQRCP